MPVGNTVYVYRFPDNSGFVDISVDNTNVYLGNATVNSQLTILGNTTFEANVVFVSGVTGSFVSSTSEVIINSTAIFIGNSSVNATINSTFSGGGGGGWGATSNLVPSVDDVQIIGNTTNRYANLNVVNVYTNTISVGNSTVNATVNSTLYSQTANNTLYVGSVTASNVVSNAQLQSNLINYLPLTGGSLSGNLVAPNINVSGNVVISGDLTIAGTTTFVNTTVITTDDLQLTLAAGATTNTLANTGGIIIGNSVALTYSDVIGGLTANLAFLPTANNLSLGSSSYLWNIFANQISGTLTTVSQPNITANNSNYLGGVAALSYVNTSGNYTLSGNITFNANAIINHLVANGVLGSASQVLTSNSTGGIYWAPTQSQTGSASNTDILFDDSGVANGIAGLTFNKTSNTLFVGNVINIPYGGWLDFNNGDTNWRMGMGSNNYTTTTIGANTAINITIGEGTTGPDGFSVGGTNDRSIFELHGKTYQAWFANTVNVGSNVSIGLASIQLGNSTVNVQINSSVISIGTATLNSTTWSQTANNSTNFAGQPQSYYLPASVGGAIQYNGSPELAGSAGLTFTSASNTVSIGNSTVNATINSTVYTGTSNNSSYLGGTIASGYQTTAGLSGNVATLTANNSTNFAGQPQSYYANISSPDFTTSIGIGANVLINTSTISIGNSTVNTYTNSTVFTGTANNSSYLGGTIASGYQTTAGLSGNVATLTANNSTNFAGQGQAYYANVTSPIITTTIEVGAASNNVTANTTAIKIGNSTVSSTVNSTIYSGTANNATNLGGTAASGYQTTAGLAGNVATLTANNSTNFAGQGQGYYANVTSPDFSTSIGVGSNVLVNTSTISIGNSTVNTQINSTVTIFGGQIEANGSLGSQGQVLTTNGATGNVYWSTVTSGGGATNPAGGNTQIQFNNSGVFGADANLSWNFSSEYLTIGNSTVNTQINSTFSTGTSNNTSFVGSTSAANVVSNTQLQSNLANYQTTAGLSGNVATLTANNSTNFAGQPQSYYANISSPDFTTSIGVGANVLINTSLLAIGNSTINAVLNSTMLSVQQANIAGNVYLGPGTTLQHGDINPIVDNTYSLGIPGNTWLLYSSFGTFGNATVNVFINSVIISIGNTTVNASINSTTFSGTSNNATNLGGTAASGYQTTAGLASNVATLTANNSTNFAGQGQSYYANVTSPVITTSLEVGAASNNITANTTAILLGNSTVKATVNSTIYSGTANNATNFAGQGQGYYANITSPDFTTSIGVGANVLVNTSTISIGNSTVNTYTNSTVFTGTANNASYLGGTIASGYQTTAGLSGNVATLTANNSTNFAGQGQAYYANISSPDFTTSIGVGANVLVNTSVLAIGNSTINTVINSTAIVIDQYFANGSVGTSGYSLLSGGVSGNAYWAPTSGGSTNPGGSNTQIQFNQSGSFGGDANLTWNFSNELLTVGNSTVNTQINSTFIVGTVNNANYLGTIAASGYQTTAGLAGNVATLTANNSTNFAGQGQAYYANITSPDFTTSIGIGANIVINTSTISIGNSTVNTYTNSTVFTGTANNATNLGGTAASGYQTTAGLSGNVATLTANNSTNFAGQGQAYYANVTSPVITTTLEVGAASNNVTLNTTAILLGNSSVSATVNSTIYSGTANNATNFAGQGQAFYANVSAPIFTTTIEVGAVSNNVTLNTTAILLGNSTVKATVNSTIYSGTANNATNLGGTAASGYQTTAGLAGNVATLTANNSTNFAGQGQAYYANVTSPVITTTLEVGAASNNVTLNTTAILIGNSTVSSTVNSTSYTGTANNSTNFAGQGQAFYANISSPDFTTSIGVGANVLVNTSVISVGNSTVNTQINSTAIVTDQYFANGGAGTAGYVLYSGGASANAYWSTAPGGGSGSPGGANTQIQFNSSGSFGGDTNLTWNNVSELLTIGNSTVNTAINSTVVTIGNSSVNTIVNSSAVVIGNSSVSVGTSNTIIIVGNSSVNTTVNSSVVFTSSLSVGNSTVNTTINNSSFSQSVAANGYTYLPGGVIFQWGHATTNTSGLLAITFPVSYVTNAWALNIEPLVATTAPAVTAIANAVSKTGFTAFTANNSAAKPSINFFWSSIGS